jgi:dihydrolipoamide dehydrogenase
MKTYDAVVIGAGPGGYVGAIRLAQRGVKTAVIEREHVGGVCLNWGCIPSKAMIAAANHYKRLEHLKEFGIEVGQSSFHWDRLREHKSKVVKKLTGGVESLLKSNKVDVIKGEATFKSSTTLAVKGQEDVSFKNAIIATGARPLELKAFPIDGTSIVHSKHIFDIAEVPKKLLVLGGGVIGLELSMVFRRLGSEVTIVEMAPTVIPGQDQDIIKAIGKVLEREGVRVLTSTTALESKKSGKNLSVSVKKADGQTETLPGDLLLMAVGMRPNADALNLQSAGVKLTEKGFVQINEKKQTSVPHIFAIGDVAGPPLLAHKASHEALMVADLLTGHTPISPRAIAGAIFTDPEIASVGLTEEQARAKGEVSIGTFPFAALGKSIATGETEGFVKIIAEKASEKIVGLHIIGHEASALIGEAALALEMDAVLEDVASTIHPHPTLNESIMEAAEAALGQAVHIPNRRR